MKIQKQSYRMTPFVCAVALLFALPMIAIAQCGSGTTLLPGTGVCVPSEEATNLKGYAAFGADRLFIKVVNFILGIVGMLSVLMIVVGGVMYVISGGNDTTAGTAKRIITYAIIGLVVALLGYAIVLLVANALGA